MGGHLIESHARGCRAGGEAGAGARGTDGPSVGADWATATGERAAGKAVAGAPDGRQRDSLEVAHRGPVAGPARAVRAVAHLLRPVRALAAGRHLGPPAEPSAD